LTDILTSPPDRWHKVEHELSEIENCYRKERLRIGSAAQPSGEAEERLLDLFEEAVRVYLDGSESLRAEMRSFIGKADCLPRGLLPVVARYLERMREKAAVHEALRLGLAAVSLENFRTDPGDSFDYLSALYRQAYGFGIDPQASFNEIARLSSSSKDYPYSWGSMQEFLSGFDQSGVFKADVLRKLKPRATS
jgi:hypothetical protein